MNSACTHFWSTFTIDINDAIHNLMRLSNLQLIYSSNFSCAQRASIHVKTLILVKTIIYTGDIYAPVEYANASTISSLHIMQYLSQIRSA